MTTARAIRFMGAMVEVTSDEIGQDNAVRKIAHEVGLGYWPAYRIAKGLVKSVSSDAFDRINARYLRFCADQIKTFQNELREAGDAHPDLEREAEALVAKLKEEKAAMRARAAERAGTRAGNRRARKSPTGELA